PRVLGAGLEIPRRRELHPAIPGAATPHPPAGQRVGPGGAASGDRGSGTLLAGRVLGLSVGAAVLLVHRVGPGPVVAVRVVFRGPLSAGVVQQRVLPAILVRRVLDRLLA